MKDQQEAEHKKVTSQEIQLALTEQTKAIGLKQEDVMEDLAKVEPAVIDAQQGSSGEMDKQAPAYWIRVCQHLSFAIIFVVECPPYQEQKKMILVDSSLGALRGQN